MIKKDIYIIRNTINDKVYIGQTFNSPERWSKHVYSARHYNTHPNGTLINKAMYELGIENFYYQVLEAGVENFNERERYWISQFNSLAPNGYNMIQGGIVSGLESPSAKLSKETLDKMIELLQFSGLSNKRIAKECGCIDWTVWAVNNGQAYFNPNLTYPLRKSNRYTMELVKQIKYSLKYELDKSLSDIAKEYNVDQSQVSEINQGKIHNYSNDIYPLRKGKTKGAIPIETATEIMSDLAMKPELSQTEIARKHNVSVNCVSGINLGRNFRQDIYKYPIRDNNRTDSVNRKKTITAPELADIERELLETDLSMREIAANHGLGLPTIQNINNGAMVSYRKDNLVYPLRKLRRK